jgi:hypothetical protein
MVRRSVQSGMQVGERSDLMAQMVPTLDNTALQQIKSDAERNIYKVLRESLGDKVLVVHSLELIAQSANTAPNDAEADFVIFDPFRGFLVIEVKGGGITYNGDERQWWSVDGHGIRHEIKDPFRQAKNAKHEILRNLKNSKSWGPSRMPRTLMGHAVFFPDIQDVNSLSGPDRPLALIGCRSSLQNISSWLDSVFDYWGKDSNTWQPLGTKGMGIVESVFCQKVVVNMPLALTIEREFQRQIELTERQGRILRSLRHRHRAAIAGGAGTGKTLIALQHAKSLASQGLLTLLVCYNRALADFLKRQVEGTPNLHAMSFHQLCDWRIRDVSASSGQDLMREAQSSYPVGNKYDVQMPYALARSTELNELRYQAIIVDEGQDFGDEYWMPIEMLLADEDDSPLFIFFDPNQAVYRMSSTFPIQEAPFYLTENCRNTRYIHSIAYQYYSGDEVDPPDLEGAPPQLIEAVGLDQQAKKIKLLVSELISKELVALQDIVILVFNEHKESYYKALLGTGNPSGAKWSFESLWKKSTVLVDTAKRFKGLEAGIVILWGLEQANCDRDRELLYVSLSRARSRLFLVGTQEMFESVTKAQMT